MRDLPPLVTALALERPMCLGCLVELTGATTRDVEDSIARIGSVLAAHEEVGRCSSCRDVGWVVSFARPMHGLRDASSAS